MAAPDPELEPTLAASEAAVSDATLPDVAPRPVGPPDPGAAVGARIGRYVVLERLGAGGMGVVYAAFDPQLDRKIALKLIRPEALAGAGAAEARARLLREAKAMARLSHPNAVTVYDAGELPEHVYLAMEHVQGCTLGRWLAAERRPWRAILDAFVQAGRGLAAAHAAGIVHRDFKPDNVLVDAQGRVKVTDLGLARALDAPSGDGPAAAGPAPVDGGTMTETGAILGTPAYMSPEQFLGQRADERSDQFSFCVALYEALYGARPFSGATFAAQQEAVVSGRFHAAPRAGEAPPWLLPILRQGLRTEPAERHPGMAHLLEALARDPARTRRRFAAGAALAAAAAAALLAAGAYRDRVAEVCAGGEARLAGLWDAPRRRAIHEAFRRTRRPWAEDAFAGLARALDRWTSTWRVQHRDACEATRLRGEQSEAMLDVRMACLEGRRKELQALGDVMAAADASVVEHAVAAASLLPDPAGCADVEALASRPPPPADPALRARADALRARLARLKAQADAGQYRAALAQAPAAVTAARALGVRGLEAEALRRLGQLQGHAEDAEAAVETLAAAVEAALADHDAPLAGAAATDLVFVNGIRRSRFAEAELWGRVGRGLLARQGARDLGLARLLNALGVVDEEQGRYDRAVASYREAIAVAERVGPAGDLERASTLNNLALLLNERHRLDEALAAGRRSLGLVERALGRHHPFGGAALSTLGATLDARGDHATALVRLGQARALLEEAFGPAHPDVAQILASEANALAHLGRAPEALARLERATTLLIAAAGPEDPEVADLLAQTGALELERRAPGRARPLLERAVAVYERAEGNPAELAQARFDLARCLWASGVERARALRLAAQAQAAYVEHGEPAPGQRAAVERWLTERQAGGRPLRRAAPTPAAGPGSSARGAQAPTPAAGPGSSARGARTTPPGPRVDPPVVPTPATR